MSAACAEADIRARIEADLHALDARARGTYRRELKRLLAADEAGAAQAARRRFGAGLMAGALWALGAICLLAPLAGAVANGFLALGLAAGGVCALMLGADQARAAGARRAAERRAHPASTALELHLAALERALARRMAQGLNAYA